MARFYPNLAKLDTPLIASIYGESIEEFRTLARELSALPKISALEVNLYISWRHYRELGAGGYRDWAGSVVAAVREEAAVPVWVKLSPDAGDPAEIARTVEAEGAAALTVSNSY
ncbi:MAG TPA: hypothetical protein GX735_01295 [Firmicutes bacterium]|nr:hypothetical protein [Bacillota bacterium]